MQGRAFTILRAALAKKSDAAMQGSEHLIHPPDSKSQEPSGCVYNSCLHVSSALLSPTVSTLPYRGLRVLPVPQGDEMETNY